MMCLLSLFDDCLDLFYQHVGTCTLFQNSDIGIIALDAEVLLTRTSCCHRTH